jgi:hypothetical protein
VNQIAPSGPAMMPSGVPPGVMPALYIVAAPAAMS